MMENVTPLPSGKMTPKVEQALRRLIAIAWGDTGQSRRVANFLLAWWNAPENGGFDLTEMWGCDQEIIDDLMIVFTWVGHNAHYPDSLGLRREFDAVVRAWRPARKP